MNIAIYHGLPIIHYEMLGYLIEYFLISKIKINIYAHISDWKEYYEKLFQINMIWNTPIKFDPNNYDLIFLLTDDDITFKNEWLDINKIVIIDHTYTMRRENGFYRFGTRFYSGKPNHEWAIPCYNSITIDEKYKYLENCSNINITCIGVQNRPVSISFLQELFVNFTDITFHIIARYIDLQLYEGYNNVHIYVNCDTNIMFDIIKKSHYILCCEHPTNPEPRNNSMSAAIPIAFSNGCNLIIPSLWQKHYNLKSIIEYNDNFLQQNGQTKLLLKKDVILDSSYNELYDLISHRNLLFDKILKIKYNSINKIPNNIYSNILYNLNLQIPNVLITNEYENIFSYDFREIHINNTLFNNIFKNNIKINYCYLYYNIDYNKINEPVIWIINSNNNIKDIELFSLRKYKDIIIINNNNEQLNDIINIYNKNKYCVSYLFDNKIFIIPQK